MEVRTARLMARQLFSAADTDESRSLDKAELANVYTKLRRKFPAIVLDPPFDLDRDFELMATEEKIHGNEDIPEQNPLPGVHPASRSAVSWEVFEMWWRKVSGDDEGTVPVLPEAMTEQANRLVSNGHGAASKGWSDTIWLAGVQGGKPAMRWAFLKPRLMMLIDLQTVWGVIGEIYGANATIYSQTKDVALSKRRLIRSPDMYPAWDAVHLFAILYAVIVVPLRVGFDYDASPWSVLFCLEAFIDLFFICDLLLMFRTAYFMEDGVLEDQPLLIAKRYIRSWFTVDLLSSFPFGYIGLMTMQSSDAPETSSPWKLVRMLRLVKMMKVTRVMELIRKVDKSGRFTDYTVAMSSCLTFLTIAYAAHLLSCFWYFSGSTNELGWVRRNMMNSTSVCPLCPNILLANK